MKKGSLSINYYFPRLRGIADNLTATGEFLSDDELLLCALGGLGSEYVLHRIILEERIIKVYAAELTFKFFLHKNHIFTINII